MQGSAPCGFLGRLRVGTKVMAGMLIIYTLIGLDSLAGYLSMRSMADAAAAMYYERLAPITLLSDMRTDLLRVREQVLLHVITRDQTEKRTLELKITGFDQDLEIDMQRYDAGRLTAEEKLALAAFRQAWYSYREGRSLVLAASSDGRLDEARRLAFEGIGAQRFNTALEYLNNLIGINKEVAERLHKQTRRAAADSSRSLATVFLAVGLIGLMQWFAVTRHITRPVLAVAQAAKRVAEGDFSGPPIPVLSGDEIGEMAASFNRMVSDLRQTHEINTRLLDEAVEQSRTDSLTGARNYRYLMELMCGGAPLPEEPGKKLAAAFVHIDQLDEIRAAFGHLSADAVLEQVGQRLLRAAPPGCPVIRIAADQFLVLIPAVDEEEAKAAAESLRQGVGAVVSVPTDIGEDCPALISASVGVALGDSAKPDLQALLRRADYAASLAIGRGGNRVMGFAGNIPLC